VKLLTRPSIALAALVALPLPAAQAQTAREAHREQVAANFREADADGDGALTRVEFIQLIDLNAQHDIGRAKLIARLDRYDMAFDRADVNDDGRVTLEDLSALASQRR